VARRAARLAAVPIAAVVLRSGRLDEGPEDDVIDVGVDGSLVEHYPGFRDTIYDTLAVVDGIRDRVAGGPDGLRRRISIGIAKDGSGVGAALIALVAAKTGQ